MESNANIVNISFLGRLLFEIYVSFLTASVITLLDIVFIIYFLIDLIKCD